MTLQEKVAMLSGANWMQTVAKRTARYPVDQDGRWSDRHPIVGWTFLRDAR